MSDNTTESNREFCDDSNSQEMRDFLHLSLHNNSCHKAKISRTRTSDILGKDLSMLNFKINEEINPKVKDSVPMTFSSFKSEKYEGMNDGCCSCSNNTQMFNSKFRSIERENAQSQERFASLLKGDYGSFTNEEK